MNSTEDDYKFCKNTDHNKINRRAFFTQSIGYTAGITLMAFPGVITNVLAAEEEKSKEDILKELEAKAEKYFPMYMTCSQPSFAALNEQFNLKADRTVSAIMPFAGGVAGKGETCGAVTGSLLAIGYHFEPINRNEIGKFGSSMKYAKLFFDRFSKQFGSTRCKEVIKHQYGRYYDWDNPEEIKLFMEASIKSPKCMGVVKKAVLIAGNIILENS